MQSVHNLPSEPGSIQSNTRSPQDVVHDPSILPRTPQPAQPASPDIEFVSSMKTVSESPGPSSVTMTRKRKRKPDLRQLVKLDLTSLQQKREAGVSEPPEVIDLTNEGTSLHLGQTACQ